MLTTRARSSNIAAIVPHAIRDASANGAVRIWSAGCASGEETYSIAMRLVEAVGCSMGAAAIGISISFTDLSRVQELQSTDEASTRNCGSAAVN